MSINSLQSFFRLSRQTFSTRTPQRLLCVPTTYLSTKHSYPLEGTRTEAVLVKKPGDREILEPVDLERTNPGVQSNECAAPRDTDARTDGTEPHREKQCVPKCSQ